MKSSKSALIFVFVTVLVDIIGLAIILPVIPSLIEHLTGEPTHDAAGWGRVLMLSFAITQLIFGPAMGELSDRFGRRPILLASLFGLGLDYLLHAYAPTITWLIIGRVLAGVAGASHTVALAYIADVSTKETKAKNFGLIGAAFGLGFIIGPAIGGPLGEIDLKLPFFVAAGISFLNLIFGFFFVPESLKPENRRPIEWKNMIPLRSLVELGNIPMVMGLIVALFLAQVGGQVMPSIWAFFTRQVFVWDESDIGISLSLVGLMVAIVQGGLVGKIQKAFGMVKTILGGYTLWVIGMSLLAFATTPTMLFVFLIPYVFGGVASPTLQGYISNKVAEDRQGSLGGAIAAMNSLSFIFGPIIATTMFQYFGNPEGHIYFPGAPFASAAVVMVGGLVVVIFTLKKVNSND